MAAQQPQQLAPGSRFNMPGVTQPIEQKENNDNTSITLSSSAVQTPSLLPLKQTDVIVALKLSTTVAQTFTAGQQTLHASSYAPYNYYDAVQVDLQNQFPAIDCYSGVDLAILNLIRPYRRSNTRNVNGASPAAGPGVYGANFQANQIAPTQFTTSATSVTFDLELPLAIKLDRYWDLDINGNWTGLPVHEAIVSPQYMTSSKVTTAVTNTKPMLASTTDNGPAVATGTGTAATASGTATQLWRRVGYFGVNDPSALPLQYNWQHTFQAKKYSLSGVSSAQIPITVTGQILLLYVRLFDPSAASGVGAPIAVTEVTECDVQFGSGLNRFQDVVLDAQRRVVEQIGTLLPEGVIAWDFATAADGRRTNESCPNTFTTAGVQINLTFSSALSSTAFAVVGIEALRFNS